MTLPDPGAWGPYLAILAMALATYLCRISGVVLMGFVPLTPRVRRGLQFVWRLGEHLFLIRLLRHIPVPCRPDEILPGGVLPAHCVTSLPEFFPVYHDLRCRKERFRRPCDMLYFRAQHRDTVPSAGKDIISCRLDVPNRTIASNRTSKLPFR